MGLYPETRRIRKDGESPVQSVQFGEALGASADAWKLLVFFLSNSLNDGFTLVLPGT